MLCLEEYKMQPGDFAAIRESDVEICKENFREYLPLIARGGIDAVPLASRRVLLDNMKGLNFPQADYDRELAAEKSKLSISSSSPTVTSASVPAPTRPSTRATSPVPAPAPLPRKKLPKKPSPASRYATRVQVLIENDKTPAQAYSQAAGEMPKAHRAWISAGCPEATGPNSSSEGEKRAEHTSENVSEHPVSNFDGIAAEVRKQIADGKTFGQATAAAGMNPDLSDEHRIWVESGCLEIKPA